MKRGKEHSFPFYFPRTVSQREMGPSSPVGTETFLSTVHLICKPISVSESVGAKEERIPVHGAVQERCLEWKEGR